MIIQNVLRSVALAIVVFYSSFSIAADSDPYQRIVIAHRLVVVAHASIVNKSRNWEEPYKTELLNEFSEQHLTEIVLGTLKSYISEKEAESLATFLESPEGQKLVRYAHKEYDINQLSSSEGKKLRSFENSDAGKAYLRFSNEGMKQFHQVIRDRTKTTIEKIQQR